MAGLVSIYVPEYTPATAECSIRALKHGLDLRIGPLYQDLVGSA